MNELIKRYLKRGLGKYIFKSFHKQKTVISREQTPLFD